MASCIVTPLMAGSCDGLHVDACYYGRGPSCCRGDIDSVVLLDVLSSAQEHPCIRWSQAKRSHISSPMLGIDLKTQEKLEWMLSQLTQKELETAARASYEFLKDPSADASACAQHIALCFLQSKKGNAQEALKKLQVTLAFRVQVDMDGLRRAFDHGTWAAEYSQTLEKFLSSGKNYVSCYDKEGRSTHVFVPRNTVHHHAEWTLKETFYTIERAIACSRAPDRSVNAVLDFAGFNPMFHSPPISLGKDFVLAVRQHYAGQIHKIFIVDAPSSFCFLWKIFQPFVGKATQDKIVFCSGTKQKEAVLGEYYSPDQATTWMRPNEGLKTRSFDLNEYLYETPFDKAFDE
jgi:CRAL/TRIO domain